MKIVCKDFPEYKGTRPPRCACVACWKVYFESNEEHYAAAKAAVFDLVTQAILDTISCKSL